MIIFKFKVDFKDKKIVTRAKRGMNKAAQQAMKDVLFVAKQIVPLDQGDLRSTGEYKKTKDGDITKHTVSFGGQATRKRKSQITGKQAVFNLGEVDYAIDQHETNYDHKNGRQWKYLETPFRQMKGGIHKRINLAIKKELNKQ